MTEEVLIKVELPNAEANDKRIDELTASIASLNKETKALQEENKKLEKTGQDNSKQYLENAKQIEINKQKIQENSASRKGLIQTIIAEDNSIKGLRVQNAELIKQRDLLNTKTKEGQAAIQRINAQIDSNTKVINTNSSAMEKQKMNIGNYASALDRVVPGLGSFASGLTNLLNPLTATAAGLGALVSLYAKSTIGAKDLTFASNQLSSATTFLGNAFANLFSSAEDGEGFFSKITNGLLFQISPALAILSRQSALNQEKLEDLNRDAKRALSEQQDLLADNAEILQQIADSQISYNDKLFLTTQAINNIRTGSDAVKKIRQDELAVLESQLALDANNEALQDSVLDKKLQISQEDKKTERLVNNILKIESNLKDQEDKRLETLALQNEKLAEQEAIKERRITSKNVPDEQSSEVELKKSIDEALLEAQKEFDDSALAQMEVTAKKAVKINLDKNKAEQKADKATTDIHRLQEDAKLAATSNGLGLAKNAFKEHTIAYKVFAIAQATIDTYRAAAMAMATAPNYILGVVFAALAVVAGLVNVAKIAGVSFAKGGILIAKRLFGLGGISDTGGILQGASHAQGGIPFSVGGRTGFEAEGGEAIINKRSTSMFRDQLSAINVAGGGVAFQTGGVVANETRIAAQSAQSQLSSNDLAALINNVQLILVREDYEVADRNHRELVKTAKVV